MTVQTKAIEPYVPMVLFIKIIYAVQKTLMVLNKSVSENLNF